MDIAGGRLENGERMQELNMPMYGKWILLVEMGQEAKETEDILESRCGMNEPNQIHALLPSMNHSNCHRCHD